MHNFDVTSVFCGTFCAFSELSLNLDHTITQDVCITSQYTSSAEIEYLTETQLIIINHKAIFLEEKAIRVIVSQNRTDF